jgi:hypothetical protein
MAARRKGTSADERQGSLFPALYPVRRPTATPQTVDCLKIQLALGQALKDCPESAAIVAARIAEMTGRPLTAAALYTYTAGSKPEHDMGISRFVAFVRATGARWLWDMLVADDGLIVMEGREAKLATYGLLSQERQRIDAQLRELKSELEADPVPVANVRRRPSPAKGGRP